MEKEDADGQWSEKYTHQWSSEVYKRRISAERVSQIIDPEAGSMGSETPISTTTTLRYPEEDCIIKMQ